MLGGINPLMMGSAAVLPPAVTTWNPLDKTGTSAVLSNGNRTITNNGGTPDAVRGTTSKSSGAWMFELIAVQALYGSYVGVAQAGTAVGAGFGIGTTVAKDDGNFAKDGTFTSGGQTFNSGKIISIGVSFGTGLVHFYVNGVFSGSKAIPSGSTGAILPYVATYGFNDAFTLNTGQTPFSYPIAGYTQWG